MWLFKYIMDIHGHSTLQNGNPEQMALLVFVISGWTYVKASQAINVLKVSLSMSACISTAYSLNSSNFCLKSIQFFEFFVFILITVTSHHIYNLLHAKISHHLCLILLIFCTLPLTTTLTFVAQFQSSFAQSAEIFAKFFKIFTYKIFTTWFAWHSCISLPEASPLRLVLIRKANKPYKYLRI